MINFLKSDKTVEITVAAVVPVVVLVAIIILVIAIAIVHHKRTKESVAKKRVKDINLT